MNLADAVPLADLLDERRRLVEVAHRLLGDDQGAQSAVDETYRRWYLLPDARRQSMIAPWPWLERTTGGICLDRFADLSPDRRGGPVRDDVVGTVAHGTVSGLGRTAEPRVHEPAGAPSCPCGHRAHPVATERHDSVAHALRQALVTEDAELLVPLLCPAVTAIFDGGGKVRAQVGPVRGDRQVAGSLLTLLSRRPRTTVTDRSVNGRTGLVVHCDHRVAAVIALDIADGHVARLLIVANPDKLRSWNRQSTLPSTAT